MAVEIGRRPLPAATPRVPLFRRVYGLGSVFGKTVRDSRLGMFTIAALLGVIILAGGATMASTYGTLETRRELATLSSTLPPVLRGLYGDPVNVDTLGGFISWHYGAYFALLAGLWSILALSSTLAGEARRGSLEFALATPITRRVVALQKLAGHLTALIGAMALIAIATWITGAGFAKLPGDEIAPAAAAWFAVALGAKALLAGAVAFALAGLVGRGAASAVAGTIMVASYLLNSYRTLVPAFEIPANLGWFGWTRDHLPLAGQVDWPGVALTVIVSIILLAIGVESFARRDVGVTNAIRTPSVPRALLGVRGPVRRSFGELLPTAMAWGIGLGLYGFVMAVSSRVFTDEMAKSPGLLEAVRNMVPGVDLTTTAGFLQFAFVDLGLVLAALAAATFVAGRSSDETGGRLELLLSTPLTRDRWSISSGIGVWLAIATTIILLAVSIWIGVAIAESDPWQPMLGAVVLALYGAAMAGVGLAVGGLTRSTFAAPAVVVVGIGTFLVDLLAQALKLPDWVRQLALSAHVGEPMVGHWDAAGIVACLAIAIGGLGVGVWGLRRRDVSP
jgi:ABC-2 type transport system permease protein